MASKADVTKAIKWFSGDGWRGVANATMPLASAATGGMFTMAPTNGATAMLAFGAVKAGFTRTPNQDTNEEDVWNNESGAAYYVHYGNQSEVIAFEAVDIASKAVATTMLRGGSSTETSTGSGFYEQIEGNSEEFSFLIQLRAADLVKKECLWIARCTLAEIPARQLGDKAALASVPLGFKPLAPSDGSKAIRRFTNWDTLA